MSAKLLSANHGAALAATLAARANRQGRGFVQRRLSHHAVDRVHGISLPAGDREGPGGAVESEHSAMGVCIGAAGGRRPRLYRDLFERPRLHGRELHRGGQFPAADRDGRGQPDPRPALEPLGRSWRRPDAARPRPDSVLLRRQPGAVRHRARAPSGWRRTRP